MTRRNDQWERMKDILPGQPSDVGVTVRDNGNHADYDPATNTARM